MDELEDLFTPLTGTGGTWFESLTDDQQAWVWRLVELARKHGKTPPGKRASEKFAAEFGVKGPSRATIPDTIDRLLTDG